MNFMPVLFCYIFQVKGQWKCDTFGEKQGSAFEVALHASSQKLTVI